MYSYVLKINSRDSVYSQVTTNPIQISLNNISNSSLVQRIVIKNATIPHVFYNVSTTNNIISFDTLGNSYTITFPIGNYNITSLINYFNSTAVSIATNVTLSFNQLTNKIQINSPQIGIFLGTSTAFHVIGLRPTENFNFNVGITTLLFMPDLSGIRNVYIDSTFSSMEYVSTEKGSGYKAYAGVVPITQPFGSIIHYVNDQADLNDTFRSKNYGQNLNFVQIGLRDVQGNLLDMQNQPWELLFKVYAHHSHDLNDE